MLLLAVACDRGITSPPATSPPTTISGAPAQVVSRGEPNRRTVALTFDAGADVGFTAQILDTLDRSGIKSTFGITGRWAEGHPDLVRRMAQAGHLVMNHSYEHRSFTGVSARPALLSPDDRRNDLERADNTIRTLTGHSTRPWFRSPYGDYDASLSAVLGSLGYRYNVLWTVDSLGWQGLSPAAITSRCLERTVPGAILLFHVGAQSQDSAALPAIIAGLRQAGYGFGTVADVVAG
ncbi:MAG: polysaccharide deacetylase family protein [Acidimicrobiales bacterium]